MSDKKIESRYVGKAVAPHLKLKGDEYLLDLSEEEALEMGVSKRDYEYVLKELESTNKRIQSVKAEYNHELELFDPQNVSKEQRQQALPSGRITTVGQEAGHDGFVVPRGVSQVKFSCIGNTALTPQFTCKTEVWGGTNYKTKFGSNIVYTDIYVPLAASGSGVTAELTFKTSDSNGGKCNWQAQM